MSQNNDADTHGTFASSSPKARTGSIVLWTDAKNLAIQGKK